MWTCIYVSAGSPLSFLFGVRTAPPRFFLWSTVQNEMNFRPWFPELNLRLILWKIWCLIGIPTYLSVKRWWGITTRKYLNGRKLVRLPQRLQCLCWSRLQRRLGSVSGNKHTAGAWSPGWRFAGVTYSARRHAAVPLRNFEVTHHEVHGYCILNYDQIWMSWYGLTKHKLNHKNRECAGSRASKAKFGQRPDKRLNHVRGSRRSMTVPWQW